MPIPQPKDNEKRNDYMGRCMHEVNKDNPKMENKQQVAICLNTYSNPQKKSKGARDGIEIDFSDKIKEMKEKKAQELIKEESKEEPKKEPKQEVVNQVQTIEPQVVVEPAIIVQPPTETKIEETKTED